jgi:hypothetical protein
MIPGSAAPLLLPVAAGAGQLAIGQAYQGGYYAGTITYGTEAWLGIGGEQYNLIVAPKASGEASTTLQYKTTLTCEGTRSAQTAPASEWDGYYNTYTSAAGGSGVHPAINYCEGLSIGGYADWYLGSTEELKVAFGNLKQLSNWQSGGAEEFTTGTAVLMSNTVSNISIYWTSTGTGCEDGGSAASASAFYNGGIIAGYNYTDRMFVRAIRRVLV